MNSIPISVVMSVYNCEKYLVSAIESVLNQTCKNFEFIIINDGSTDNSLQIINSFKDPRIVVIDQENKGLSKALNVGIAISRSDLIVRMDADDICMETRIQKQIEFMGCNPDCVACGSNAIYIDKDGRELYTSEQVIEWGKIKSLLPFSPFYHSSVIFRKSIFEKCGGYFEDIKQNFEDRVLWNLMAKYGELRNIQAALIKYRIVPSGISNRSKKENFILNKICNNVIETGKLNEVDKILLEKTVSRSNDGSKLASYYLRIGKIYLEQNFNRIKALKNLTISIWYNPKEKVGWFNLALCFIPRQLVKRWKKSRGV